MQVEIDPSKEIFKWGPINFKLLYPSLFIETLLIWVPKYYPWAWPPNLTIFSNGKGVWMNENLIQCKVGAKYFKKYFLDSKKYIEHWQKWENWVEEYKIKTSELNRINFKKLTNKELYEYLKDFYDLNIRFWLIVHVPEIANWGGEYLLRNKLKGLFGGKTNEYLEVLSAPVKFSFFQEEELDLLQIGFIKNKKEQQEAFRNHTKKYYWVLNSYGGNRILKKNYFKKKFKSLLKEKSAEIKIKEIKGRIKDNKQRKNKLIKKLKLNKEMVLIAEQLSQSIWWQDLRKGYIWRMHYFWDKFLKEIARRKNWKFSELQWCWAYELLNILGDKRVNKEKVVRRKRYYAIFAKEGKMREFIDRASVKNLIDTYLKVDIKHIKVLKGLAISRGRNRKIRGRVKVIRNPFLEGKKMEKGDILVAGMTSPEFIVVMRKAVAVITDEGGLTSHAAIVSRELGIPCIVGTKIATKVLKDGDLVEVDGERGIVRVLNSQSK